MCGIAGVIAWSDEYRVERDVLERMSQRLAHRGPDGAGIWINHDGPATPDNPRVALVHRRLAILDPDPRANQPLTDGRGNWIVFNGEIYNYRELRKELEALDPSYQWKTTGDTEVLLRAYAAWGAQAGRGQDWEDVYQDFIDRLDGMFAFCIWDQRQQRVTLNRDRMGQKPLYWTLRSGNDGLLALAFVSELPALSAVPRVDRNINQSALREYLRWGFVPGSQSIHFSTQQLAPDSWQSFDRRGRRCCYFDRHADVLLTRERTSALVKKTRTLILDAVRRQLVSDVPLGCFLSGGIDSSIMAYAMTQAVGSGQEVMTFSIGFDDPRYDETPYAREVAKHLGTKHHEFIVKPNAAEDLPKLAAVFGEPFGDSSALPTHYLARETRKHVKVALSGDGGDELFGGYDRYRAMALGRTIQQFTTRWPWIVLWPLLKLLPDGHPKSKAARARRFALSLGHEPKHRYEQYVRLMDEPLIESLLGPCDESSDWRWPHTMELHQSPVCGAALADRSHYLPDDLLTKVDRCSMLHALEVRSPFMDPAVVAFAQTLREEHLIHNGHGKRLLREAFANDLPPVVFNRPKMGFAVPIGDWFRGELRPLLHDALFSRDSFASGHFQTAPLQKLVEDHESERRDHSQRLYAVLMLELWWKSRA